MELSQIFLGACIGYAIMQFLYIVVSLLLLKFNKPKEGKIVLNECLTKLDGLEHGR